LDLNHVVRQSIKMLDRTIPRMVEIRHELAEGLCPYLGDAAQTEQVVINLGINAADAMPDGGILRICTDSVDLDKKYSEEHAEVEPGPYLRLTVSDNGQGIDAEMVEKIFDPFFTTKEAGKGTGLGLSTVYGVVKDHGGHITCRSRIGEGTTFDIFLPAYQAESQGVQGEAARAVDSTNGAGETVLVVDDEPALRELGCMVLASAGYCTLQADSGEQALEHYQESDGEIDLVLLDISMPGMGGHRCLQEILKRSPSARVVVASGYATDQSWDDFLREGAKGFVAKPFRRDELLNAVRRALDAPAAKGQAESSSLTGQTPS
jgi:CheY-like chemotaxis protein